MHPDDTPPSSPPGYQPDLFDPIEPRPTSADGARPADRQAAAAAKIDHAHAVYSALRAHLARAVVGHAHVRDQLALLGTRHALGLSAIPGRAVLIGPSGCGKTTMVRALAEVLGCPHAVVDVTELAETNWAGLQIADVLGDLWAQAEGSLDRMARAVIVLDEIDKLATHGMSGVSRDYQLGRQRSLLPLLGGTAIHFSPPKTRDQRLTWSSGRALIVGAGVFAGLPTGEPPTGADIERLGFEHELVERLGLLVRLGPLGPKALQRVLREGLRESVATYAAFGFVLTVTDEACGLVARAVTEGRLGAGPRQAVTMLAGAAQARLLQLLEARSPIGTTVTVAPDDLEFLGHLRERRGR